jgi:hypothetical protein
LGSNTFELLSLGKPSNTYSENFKAENQADQQSFVTQSNTPIQPGGSQTGDVVFDLPASGLHDIRTRGAGLLFGDFGVDLTQASATNDPSAHSAS